MRSFKKCIVFAVVTMMLVFCISCGKAEDSVESAKESVQVEAPEEKEANKEEAQVNEAEEVKEEVKEEPVEEDEEETAGAEESKQDESEVSPLTGTYLTTLIGEKGLDQNDSPYIESVEIEDGYLVIRGSLQGISDDIYDDDDDIDDDDDDIDDNDDDIEDNDDDTDDNDDEDKLDNDDEDLNFYEFDTYRFKITEETEFYSAGGSLGAISINLDEFVELAHYYNGLGMILEIEDGVIEEGRITS